MAMKKTSAIALLVCCIYVVGFAQKSSLHWGFTAQGMLTKPEFKNAEMAEADQTVSFGLGTHLYLGITERLLWSPGIAYRNINSKQIDYSFNLGCENNGQGGVDFKKAYLKGNYSLSYLAMPISLRYQLWGEENQMFLQVGSEAAALLGKKQTFTVVDCDNTSSPVESNIFDDNLPRWQVSSSLGMGFELKITESLRAFILPTICVYWTSFLKEGEANSQLYQIGLQAGLRL